MSATFPDLVSDQMSESVEGLLHAESLDEVCRLAAILVTENATIYTPAVRRFAERASDLGSDETLAGFAENISEVADRTTERVGREQLNGRFAGYIILGNEQVRTAHADHNRYLYGEVVDAMLDQLEILDDDEFNRIVHELLSVRNIQLEFSSATTDPEAKPLDDPSTVTRKRNGGRKHPARNVESATSSSTAVLQKYLHEIGQHPLLTKDQERDLGRLIQRGIKARDQLATIDDAEITPEEAEELQQVIAEGEEAKSQFITANLRLVVSIAKRYVETVTHLKLLDLIQAGNVGMMHAVDKFDPEKGFKFSTYSTWWIRQAIEREIANKDREIRRPVHIVNAIATIEKTRARLAARLDRRPTVDEIAEETGMKPDKVASLLDESSQTTLSSNEPLGGENERTLEDLTPDYKAENQLEAIDSKSELDSLISDADLSIEEQYLLSLIYGVIPEGLRQNGTEPHRHPLNYDAIILAVEQRGLRFAEIGVILGFNPQTLRNRHKNILRKLSEANWG